MEKTNTFITLSFFLLLVSKFSSAQRFSSAGDLLTLQCEMVLEQKIVETKKKELTLSANVQTTESVVSLNPLDYIFRGAKEGDTYQAEVKEGKTTKEIFEAIGFRIPYSVEPKTFISCKLLDIRTSSDRSIQTLPFKERLRDPVVQDPGGPSSLEDPRIQDPTIQDPSIQDPTIQDPTIKGPGPTIQNPIRLQDPSSIRAKVRRRLLSHIKHLFNLGHL